MLTSYLPQLFVSLKHSQYIQNMDFFCSHELQQKETSKNIDHNLH